MVRGSPYLVPPIVLGWSQTAPVRRLGSMFIPGLRLSSLVGKRMICCHETGSTGPALPKADCICARDFGLPVFSNSVLFVLPIARIWSTDLDDIAFPIPRDRGRRHPLNSTVVSRPRYATLDWLSCRLIEIGHRTHFIKIHIVVHSLLEASL